jgi:hypothetical protein
METLILHHAKPPHATAELNYSSGTWHWRLLVVIGISYFCCSCSDNDSLTIAMWVNARASGIEGTQPWSCKHGATAIGGWKEFIWGKNSGSEGACMRQRGNHQWPWAAMSRQSLTKPVDQRRRRAAASTYTVQVYSSSKCEACKAEQGSKTMSLY